MCKKEPNWSKNNLNKWSQLKFNISFLREEEDKYSKLFCEYCGTPLRIYDWCEKTNINDVATVDHFLPKSKYDHLKTNGVNLVISCHSCNNKKKDEIWSTNRIKYPLNKDKPNLLDDLFSKTPHPTE